MASTAPKSETTPSDSKSLDPLPAPKIPRLPLDEEATLLTQSNNIKSSANSLFTISDYTAAITGYERALTALPTYLDYEMAVLRSNITACYVKLAEWKSVVEEADKGLEHLEFSEKEVEEEEKKTAEEKVVEVVDEEDAKRLDEEDKERRRKLPGKEDVIRIRSKLLLRRAKARMEIGGWAALQGAQEDYTTLSSFLNLSSLDRKTVQNALKSLPPRLDQAKQAEMGEMMGKLKQLGNGLLKPFGLSTDNFNLVQDEKTGGYNVNFDQKR